MGRRFCRGKHILLTGDLGIYTKPPIHFFLPGEGGEHMAFLVIEGRGFCKTKHILSTSDLDMYI